MKVRINQNRMLIVKVTKCRGVWLCLALVAVIGVWLCLVFVVPHCTAACERDVQRAAAYITF